MELTFRGIAEDAPGAAWFEVFQRGWPGWRSWYLARGGDRGPSIDEAARALRRYMPEIEGLWECLVSATNAGDEAARFLSFWRPPQYLVSCSQAVAVDSEGPSLVRNYDLDPKLNEATMLLTRWRGRAVIGMVDGMAGLADGMNDAGLAVSLSFGGRAVTGPGFGIPLIMRYVLEICSDVAEAIEALRAIPSHMSYNITLIDRNYEWATVFVAPDRPSIVMPTPWSVNHQLGNEWPRHCRKSNTLKRGAHLKSLYASHPPSGAELAAEFRRAPLFSSGYNQGFGTVYTAEYRPHALTAALSWSDGTVHQWQMKHFVPACLHVAYRSGGSMVLHAPAKVISAAPGRQNKITTRNLEWDRRSRSNPAANKGKA